MNGLFGSPNAHCVQLEIRISTMQQLRPGQRNIAWLIQIKTLVKEFIALSLKCRQTLFLWHIPIPSWVENNSSESQHCCLSLIFLPVNPCSESVKVSFSFWQPPFSMLGLKGHTARLFPSSPACTAAVRHGQGPGQHRRPHACTQLACIASFCLKKCVPSYQRLRAHN